LNYPLILWGDHRLWIVPVLGGLGCALFSRNRKPVLLLAAGALALLTLSMLISMRAGIGSNLRARFSMFLLLGFLPLTGGIARAMWSAGRSRWTAMACRGGLIAWCALLVLTSGRTALRYYPNWYGAEAGDFALVELINRQED